tara:strand:- start:324 stop:614 length:291 start_codon:yes stop_codon:yes gene_type:complete
MNISEQEKNRIRGLHSIREQQVPVDSAGNPIEPNPLLTPNKEQIVKKILGDSLALTKYIENFEGGIQTKEQLSKDLTTHQTRLNDSIGAFITFLEG